MTTAELAIVSTMVVGVSAAAAPTLTAWAGRKHESTLTRSRRLYEQRHTLYTDLAVYLERTRMSLASHPTKRTWPDPPTTETADQWIDLMARAAVHGSSRVKAKLDHFDKTERDFYLHLGWVQQEGGSRGLRKPSMRSEMKCLNWWTTSSGRCATSSRRSRVAA
jgi:hypothetical protein